MQISYDRLADAMYIRLAEGKVARTQVVNEDTLLNIGESGEVVGIELLGVSDWVQDPERVDYIDNTTPYPDLDTTPQKTKKRDA